MRPSMANAAEKTEETENPRREKVYNPKSTPARQGKRGLTVYIDPVAHGLLKEIAEEKTVRDGRDDDVTLKELLLEGINLILQRYGKKPVA